VLRAIPLTAVLLTFRAVKGEKRRHIRGCEKVIER
jgi:hypothetical protein